MTGGWLLALSAACGGGLAVLLWRARRRGALLAERLEAASHELERLQTAFAHFVPGDVVEQVIATGRATAAERREVTVLFVDLVGFTALSESVEPSTLLQILNRYFEHMSAAVAEHRGHVTDLIGDGLLALFGALEPNPWQEDDAAHAALAMREALVSYNEELDREGLPHLGIGIGLHHGPGVVGLVGSRARLEYTVVGRTINLASRIQELTRDYDVDVLLTEDVRATLDPRFRTRPLASAALKGISEPVQVYALEAFGPTPEASPAGEGMR